MLVRPPDGHRAPAVRKALAKRITTLPTESRRSITWDQGKEMAEHVRFKVDTDIQIYFCDPKSPPSAARTRTPTVCCASTCPKVANCPSIFRLSSTPSPGDSMNVLDERSAVCHHLRHSPRPLRWLVESAPNNHQQFACSFPAVRGLFT